ncbi:hypothetical protein [Roseateles albus]|uniref:Uncharacterized protein n=1 Tax=Roseateles albus TaxID=2987525 RepID=A0ABT5KFD0_9BURK|nr:hypothetical protein [Roseateles albus]MDC8772626.1 hypothetical protein [Roseateles albus]
MQDEAPCPAATLGGDEGSPADQAADHSAQTQDKEKNCPSSVKLKEHALGGLVSRGFVVGSVGR